MAESRIGFVPVVWKGLYGNNRLSQRFLRVRLPETTYETLVGNLKNNFSRHGIPHTLVSDNGPQYSSAVSRKFTQNWQFVHEASSSGNSQGSKIAKRLLRKCKAAGEHPYLGLLNIRNTPTEGVTTNPTQHSVCLADVQKRCCQQQTTS